MTAKDKARVIGAATPRRASETTEASMANKNTNGNDNVIDNLPGIGPLGAIEDCSIGAQGAPGTVTVTFSHMSGETLLILDPDYAELLAGWLIEMANKARQPEPMLALVKG